MKAQELPPSRSVDLSGYTQAFMPAGISKSPPCCTAAITTFHYYLAVAERREAAAYPPNVADAVEVQSAAQSIGRQLLVLKADSAQSIDTAFATLLEQHAEALLVGGDPFLENRYQQLVALATRHAIPAIYNFRESVRGGGLMSYGANISNNYRQLGAYAGRILKGENAADLPIIFPAIFDFAINLVTARALGFTVPPMLLARADEVIE